MGGQAEAYLIEATLLPGVTDPAAENLLRAARLLGVEGLERAATGQRFRLGVSCPQMICAGWRPRC
jgi:hypothetical protein